MRQLSCQEVLDQLWEYLDEDSRAELSAEIDGHLKMCQHCQVEVDSIRQTIQIYRAEVGTAPVPVQFSDRLHEALEAAYRESEKPPDDSV